MTVLIFPDNPVNGQLYPPQRIPNVEQYVWNAATNTWEISPPPGVQLIETGTGLTGGPITYEGTISIADTEVIPGSYTNASITVNAQGQITEAESGEACIPESIVDAKGDLIVGEDNDTPAILSVGNDGDLLVADSAELLGVKWEAPVPSIPESLIDNKGDIIVGLTDDTPSVLPVGSDGDVLVADSGELLGVKWEAPVANIPESIIQAKGDLIVGQGPSTPDILPVDVDGYVLTLDSAEPLGVKWAPSSLSPTTLTLTELTTNSLAPGQSQDLWVDLGSLFSLVSIEVTTPPEDGWIRLYTSEAGMLADTRIVPGPPFPFPSTGFAAEIVTTTSEPIVTLLPVLTLYSEDGLFVRFTNQSASTQVFTVELASLTTIPSQCQLPPYSCNPYVNTSCVTDFDNAWANCGTITSFPALDFGAGLSFNSTWQNCVSLTSFPANLFDSCVATDFQNAWDNCSLTQTSVDNILVSLDTAGQSNGTVNVGGGTSSPPGVAGSAAKLSLEGKGWTVNVNLPPCDLPPYFCNTSVNPYCVTDFSSAPDGSLNGDTPSLVYVGGTTILAEAFNYFSDYVTGGSGTLGEFYLDRGPVGEIVDLGIYGGSGYDIGDTVTLPGSLIGGTDGVDDITITLSATNGMGLDGAWAYCTSITSFPSINVSSGINFSNAWLNCSNLATFPLLNTSNGVYFSETWANCASLTSFPSINTGSGVDFTLAWAGCTSLTSFPALDLSSASVLDSAWSGCTALTSFPAINIPVATDIRGAWQSCTGLTSFSAPISSPAVTNFYTTWTGCSGLTSFPSGLDTSAGTNFGGTWASCTGLTSFPGTLDLSAGTDFSGTWYNCTGLTSFPGTLDLSSGTNFSQAWGSCSSLTAFPGTLDVSSGTDFYYAWKDCSSLTSFPSLNFSSGTNFGGSWFNCSSLTSFPALNLSSGTSFGQAWQGCTGLTTFPVITLASGTNFIQAWQGCTGLTSFPTLNFASATNFNYAWDGCTSLATFPANVFDTCAAKNFAFAWRNCALDQTSVDNILVSLDTAGQNNGTLGMSGGTSSTPGPAGLAAKASLQGKGWTVTTN